MPNDNPYESPRTPPQQPSGGNVVALVLLILLSIPAAAIAFFGVCAATIMIGNADAAIPAGFLLGGITGLAVLGGGIYLAVRVYRKGQRQ